MGREEKNEFDQKHAYKQALPFCVVNIWPRNLDSIHGNAQILRLFERKDEEIFRISENIRDKVFDREKVIQRLKDLNEYYLRRINGSIEGKKEILTQLYEAIDLLSFDVKRTREEHVSLPNKRSGTL
ncbi:hypothetical protein PIB30_029822 [Stylosanthes scabra]|uniref:Uncharacterized protein n=1 Tax=Stylosanthes scabra TaxID=79078 RepID=A0ABU6VAA0_9FABA|nr:hypothetical protein [Stylosanthes scabra]